jgi:hypothetical protein
MTRGGQREGAGRPEGSTIPNPKKMVTIRLKPYLAAWLKKKSRPGLSQSDLIEKALIEYYDLKSPKPKE